MLGGAMFSLAAGILIAASTCECRSVTQEVASYKTSEYTDTITATLTNTATYLDITNSVDGEAEATETNEISETSETSETFETTERAETTGTNETTETNETYGTNETAETSEPGYNLTELYRCHGMSSDECQRQKDKLALLRRKVSRATGQPEARDDGELDPEDEKLDKCIILTEDQLDVILANMDRLLAPGPPTANRSAGVPQPRHKRNLVDFQKSPVRKWTMPIQYKFDGTQNTNQRAIIRNAFQHWTDNTCARFTEVASAQPVSDSHLLLTSEPNSCYSYVGRTELRTVYQQLNLGDACLYRFGTPVHEIGHALGLWHTQMRADKDEAIRVLWENIVPDFSGQFAPQIDTNPLGVPYDLSSVMHYSSLDGVSANGKNTMVAINPLYQMNMGQRTGLSFNDIRIINLAYCKDICKQPTSQPCQRGGYQDPNNCARCLCPDGFSGPYCNQVAPPRNAQCGGEISLVPGGTQQIVKSPRYDEPAPNHWYTSYQECSWLIKAPAGYKVKLNFEGEFGLYSQYTACYHWVEVKYKADIGLEGARFCGYQRPNVTVTSESSEMMLVFKSNFSVNYPNAQRGFKAVLSLEGSSRVTPPPKATPSLSWQCSFEPGTTDPLCGMTQDKTDQFDWTIFKGPTPSDPTGPDAAQDKDYYIYIEASEPQKPNDEARLFFPSFDQYTGDACVSFYYHMYGFHINTLKLVQISQTSTRILWLRSMEMGNVWMRDSVTVNIQPNTRLQFVGIRGGAYSGDIGLDLISAQSGACNKSPPR